MFEGNLAEKGEIAIPDIEQEVFTMFLRYLYTDTIELTVDTATSVLSAARKYMVDRLVKKCETFLKSSLTTENVCLLLEQAHIYTEESLKEDCINKIARSPEEVLKSTSFVELCGVCVKSITDRAGRLSGGGERGVRGGDAVVRGEVWTSGSGGDGYKQTAGTRGYNLHSQVPHNRRQVFITACHDERCPDVRTASERHEVSAGQQSISLYRIQREPTKR
ncbi:BTB/POZ domain-containing protein 6-like [Mizuhopecten yessoensis]|uniref:BTB/POZ domain-containing protein 6-like n=1 Tax=Mizuhopecten yessoensis TaxID=6573 RepID=UPI000B45B52E|nr:BTB/POZ domain-containing protein 6-like [Mizuhopecten yessoensis]